MAKGKLIYLLFGIFLVGLASAISFDWTDLTYPVKQGECFNIFGVCENCSYMNITVLYTNGTPIITNEPMTSLAGDCYYNYSFCNTSSIGIYPVIFSYKNQNGIGGETDFFEVSYSGLELSTGSSIFYAVLIFLMVLLLAGALYGTGKLPSMNEKDEEGRIMSVKWAKYLRAPLYFVSWMLFIAILYISSNLAFAYLGEQLFAKVLFSLYRIAFGITPLIVVVWFVWFFVKVFQDKKLQTLLNRGLFPQKGRR